MRMHRTYPVDLSHVHIVCQPYVMVLDQAAELLHPLNNLLLWFMLLDVGLKLSLLRWTSRYCLAL